jgi:hypothetical protein
MRKKVEGRPCRPPWGARVPRIGYSKDFIKITGDKPPEKQLENPESARFGIWQRTKYICHGRK